MTMNTKAILGSAYLAPIEYYTKLLVYETVYVERFDCYMKQTYRNRCMIASADGILSLTVPVEKGNDAKCLMKDVRISEHGNWRHVHWNAFTAAYRHSPFFDYYADEFRVFFERKYEFLFDFNEALCRWFCEQIDFQSHIVPSETYLMPFPDADDFREIIHPKRDFREVDSAFCPKPYYQVFREKTGFLPNLSIVDLLFNMGPESILVLKDCVAG